MSKNDSEAIIISAMDRFARIESSSRSLRSRRALRDNRDKPCTPCAREYTSTKEDRRDVRTRTYVDTMKEEEEEASFIRITRRRFFFITVRADCIFLRPSAARTGGRGGGGVSNPENHVERGPSNHWCSWQSCPASASLVPRLRDPSILDAILAQKGGRGKDRRKGGCPFYSRAVGTPSPPFLSLPFFTLPPFLLLSSPPFLLFSFHRRDRPFTPPPPSQGPQLFDRPALHNLRLA